jgi:rhamnose utilization protein RhaD (predicted bifunctional aldolase and dehydrogenase)
MSEQALLARLTGLSHEFGTPDYAKGGGGNTSVKLGNTLWIKPSGTTLAGLQPEQFVAVDRARLAALYAMEVPEDAGAREARVQELMAAAVCGGSRRRPSVETPLHDLLEATYVVHTHPTLVNGLTCSRDGAAAAARLFPDALWVPYIDPGFTLSMQVRARVEDYRRARGCAPALILLQNHGIFVSANEPAEVRELYRHVVDTLRVEYRHAGIATSLKYASPTLHHELEELSGMLGGLLGPAAAAMVGSAPFEVADGPLTPDHMVYAKAYPYRDAIDRAHLQAFRARHGYAPRVVVTAVGVFGLGASAAPARLALELAQDGALVRQLAEAFGGVRYMDDAARRFIESWEVESYREQQVAPPAP